MAFSAFFNLSLNFAIRNSWSEPQSVPSFIFTDHIELLHFGCKEHNQSDFGIDHLVIAMCRIISWVVGISYFIWQACSLEKSLLEFACLILYSKSKESESEVAQSHLTLCDPMDCRLPGSSIHGIFQAIILELVAMSFSRGSSWLRDWTQVACIIDRHFTIWATREVHGSSCPQLTQRLQLSWDHHCITLRDLI